MTGKALAQPLMEKENDRAKRIQDILDSEDFKAYKERVEKHHKNCLAVYLTRGIAAVCVGTTIIGFLTPLNAMMLIDIMKNSSNSTAPLATDQTDAFGIIVSAVFMPKLIWTLSGLVKVFGQAPRGLFLPGRHLLVALQGFVQTATPLSLLTGVLIGRFPQQFSWVPSAITAPRAFGVAGSTGLLGEVFVPNHQPGVEDESCKGALQFIFSRFKKLAPWEMVVLFCLTTNIFASAETDNYGNRPEVAQGIALALTFVLGSVLVTMGVQQCKSHGTIKSLCARSNSAARLGAARDPGEAGAPLEEVVASSSEGSVDPEKGGTTSPTPGHSGDN